MLFVVIAVPRYFLVMDVIWTHVLGQQKIKIQKKLKVLEGSFSVAMALLL
jgi:hypothetical protein